jgi:hypothetical protein
VHANGAEHAVVEQYDDSFARTGGGGEFPHSLKKSPSPAMVNAKLVGGNTGGTPYSWRYQGANCVLKPRPVRGGDKTMHPVSSYRAIGQHGVRW